MDDVGACRGWGEDSVRTCSDGLGMVLGHVAIGC